MAEVDIQRRPTVPMTRKDSLSVQEHDLSTRRKSREINLKRADSYKQATNRLSVYDNLSFNDNGGDHKTKYNTLPVNSKLNLLNGQNKTQTMNGFASGHSGSAVHRNVSQKSGSFPSPDTDEYQRSVPDIKLCKKKTWFERNIKQPPMSSEKYSDDENIKKDKKHSRFTFRKQKVSDKDKTKHTNNSSSVMKISHLKRESYTEQHSKGTNGVSRTTEKRETVDIKSAYGGLHGTHRETYTKEVTEESDSSTAKQGPLHFFSRLRKSFRKKKKGNPKQIKDNGQPSIPKEVGLTDTTAGPQQSHQTDTTPGPHQSHQSNASHIITDIFEALIDPSLNVNRATFNYPPEKKADRSKLHLGGLRKARPALPETGSFCRSSSCSITEREILDSDNRVEHKIDVNIHEHKSEVLTPTVEIDGPGFDYTDGVDGLEQEHDEVNPGTEFSQADDAEQNRRLADVAHRLQLIGDSIVTRRESSQSSSEAEGGAQGFEQGALIEYLRQIGDDLDSRIFNQRGFNVTPVIMPVIHNLIMAKTDDQFQSVIRRELQDTVGWEQVAWYTYLTRSAIFVVLHGRQVVSQLKQMARHYFSEHIQPFIQQRPNGWESVLEETDGELD